ncbi:MAG: hypothetical protein K8R59_18225 [Thermoanaerobaculales bacterium]|nr:hypothetical protein [Thermoanaerobaculales bacterium]
MKNVTIVTIAVLALAVSPVWAEQNGIFGWEDGTSTALGTYGGNLTLENSAEQANGGVRSLKMTEDPLSGTPHAFIWWITGLVDGDTVTASFWVYDTTPAASPSSRIWGHYTDTDVNSYSGSADGNGDYSDGSGWSQLSWTWTFDSNLGANDGLVVEARIYSGDSANILYIDDAAITVSSDTAIVYAPDGTVVPVELMSFSVE